MERAGGSGWVWADKSNVGAEVDDVEVVVVGVKAVPEVVAVVDVVKVVLDWEEEEEEELVVCRTLTNRDNVASNVAKTWGLEGNTSNRATPSSQQKARWPSQQ
ncbi:hypothetical protein MFIFM68171_09927 [Madurella fahalii]|uniref:Uncharacterized protein n=1 Tax=Madurella fahalii TaxID=1157608 RepID=A0ABQ0GPQ7_9PEZI